MHAIEGTQKWLIWLELGVAAEPLTCVQIRLGKQTPSGKSLTGGTHRQRSDPVGIRHLPCDLIISLERIQPDRSALGQRIGRCMP